MLVQFLDESIRLRPVHPYDVMQVRPDVQIRPARGLVDLSDAVLCHGGDGSLHVEVGEEGRGADFAGVVETVCAYERRLRLTMAVEEEFLGGLVKVVPCCARICELGLAALAWGWDGYGAEGGVGGAAGIETAVYVLWEGYRLGRGGREGERRSKTKERERKGGGRGSRNLN